MKLIQVRSYYIVLKFSDTGVLLLLLLLLLLLALVVIVVVAHHHQRDYPALHLGFDSLIYKIKF
jgi:hypothetical protein